MTMYLAVSTSQLMQPGDDTTFRIGKTEFCWDETSNFFGLRNQIRVHIVADYRSFFLAKFPFIFRTMTAYETDQCFIVSDSDFAIGGLCFP